MVHPTMTVRDLRVMIADLPDWMFVLVPGTDHEYALATVGVQSVQRVDTPGRPPEFHECAADGTTNTEAFIVGR